MPAKGIETDRYGNELVKVSVEDIVKDLSTLTQEQLLAVSASMGMVLFPFEWVYQFNKIKEGLNGK